MAYVDLNMVRAGVVRHPSDWPFCGYNEIQNPPLRYSLVDQEGLADLFDIKSMDDLKRTYRGWVEEALEKQDRRRQPRWTESIAVGSEDFMRNTKEKLGIRAVGREVIGSNGSYVLQEPETSYEANFSTENVSLREENTFYWDISAPRSIS
jgi:hypothetical protein